MLLHIIHNITFAYSYTNNVYSTATKLWLTTIVIEPFVHKAGDLDPWLHENKFSKILFENWKIFFHKSYLDQLKFSHLILKERAVQY